MNPTTPIALPTRRLDPALEALLAVLSPGDRIRITQTVRVGSRSWQFATTGAFRGLGYLATGITTDRVPDDDIVVPTVHFTKDNGELASVTLDEHTRVERA
jgi:hypothetical protein